MLARPQTPVRFALLRRETADERNESLRFILSEARHGTKSIGFIPQRGLERAIDLGRVGVLRNNDDRVGFCVWGGSCTTQRIFQIWVREDARLIMHGRELLSNVERFGMAAGRVRIRLWCLDDLPSTLFWQAMQFQRVSSRVRSVRRSRTQSQWERAIVATSQSLFPEPI